MHIEKHALTRHDRRGGGSALASWEMEGFDARLAKQQATVPWALDNSCAEADELDIRQIEALRGAGLDE